MIVKRHASIPAKLVLDPGIGEHDKAAARDLRRKRWVARHYLRSRGIYQPKPVRNATP